MGTYDTRGGAAASPVVEDPVIYAEEEQALMVLEQAGVASEVNDQVAAIIRSLCERQPNSVVPQRDFEETISWNPVSSLPDSDLTVQLFDENCNEPVWPGYFDGEQWLYADGSVAHPSSWAHFAKGPVMRPGKA